MLRTKKGIQDMEEKIRKITEDLTDIGIKFGWDKVGILETKQARDKAVKQLLELVESERKTAYDDGKIDAISMNKTKVTTGAS